MMRVPALYPPPPMNAFINANVSRRLTDRDSRRVPVSLRHGLEVTLACGALGVTLGDDALAEPLGGEAPV